MIALYITLGVVAILAIAILIIVYKINHLVTPALIEKSMELYRKNSTTDAQTITSVQQLAMITSISSTIVGKGPITITPAKLNGEKITLITLGGTQKKQGQATTMQECKLSIKGKPNDYYNNVLDVLYKNVPKKSKLLISGLSLGGMIAQQLISNEEFLNDYEIIKVITFGSPITIPYDRKNIDFVRFVDERDIVPKLGDIILKRKDKKAVKLLHEKERIVSKSKYKKGIEPHAFSYIEDECWNKYDFMGDTNHSNTLEVLEPLNFYENPIRNIEK